MNISMRGIRRLVTVLGAAAALLAVAGCDDSPPASPTPPTMPTLKTLDPDAP